ncbi:hypothetical protein [Rhodospirillaceae bacterium SYSU D60014]|uniref:hypothetical protein n=1 Tax=Virgifigura deserti TaxID=2268457 RepID=UPI000E66E048
MFFKRKQPKAPVHPGTRFRRTHSSNLVETVEVLDVYRDYRGIQHVRFEVSFGWPRPLYVAAQSRLLCLEEFTSRYSPAMH